MKKYKYGIIGVVLTFIIATIFFFSIDALAEETIPACTHPEATDIEERYKLTLEKIGTNQFRVRMAGKPSDLRDAKFKIIDTVPFYENDEGNDETKAKIIAINDIPLITKDSPAYFNAEPEKIIDGGFAIKIKLQLVEGSSALENCDYTGTIGIKWEGNAIVKNVFDDLTKDNANSIYHEGSICYNFYNAIWNAKQFIGISKSDFEKYNYISARTLTIQGKPAQTIYDDILAYCKSKTISAAAEYTEENLANMMGNLITYVKAQTKTLGKGNSTFATLFASTKKAALDAGNDKSGKDPKDTNLKCNWKLKATGKDGDAYYVNKNYYYKKEKGDPIKVKYTYNYAPGNVKTETIDVCTRVCEEAVKVEYGPPVASKAGLCFQYKVKVTSYVQCEAVVVPEPPTPNGEYCSPEPYCHERNWRWEGHNAGPNEEFDLCIDKCDGGKYTSKCSQKCYNEVYGKSKLPLTADYEAYLQNLAENTGTALDKEIEACMKQSSDKGCYYWSGDTILWKSEYQKGQDFIHDSNALGRWYREQGGSAPTLDFYNNRRYDSSSNGIKTRDYTNRHCNDICYWKTDTCTKGKYLNPQAALEDYQNNLKAYQAAVNQCKAAATCSSSTAEYTISLNYDTKQSNGSIKVNKQSFPISSKDQISSKGSGSSNINTATSKNTTIIDYHGCYKESNEKNWYLTEWSFPGTYIHNKTGEISFKVPDSSSGWYYETNKFCMPLNAMSVNTKWWEWAKLNNSCYTTAEIEKELKGTKGTSNGYNIDATVKNFGYFGWEFDIKCFYAMKNEICDINENGCCKPNPNPPCTDPPCNEKKTIGTDNYTIRTVDLENLFPNAKVEGVVDNTKRDIGFNWTQKARISATKNSAYEVDPSKLIETIQNNANTLYSDSSNLDYQFYLTPNTLKAIRQYNKKYAYGVWNGTTIEKNGIMAYSSNLFRSTGVETNILSGSDDTIKKLGEIGINNEN